MITRISILLVLFFFQICSLSCQSGLFENNDIYIGVGSGISQFRYTNTDDFRFFFSGKENSMSFYAQLDLKSDKVVNRKSIRIGYHGFRDTLRTVVGGNGANDSYEAKFALNKIQVVGKFGWDLRRRGVIIPFLDLGASIGHLSKNRYSERTSSFQLGVSEEIQESSNFQNVLNPILFGILAEAGFSIEISKMLNLNLAYEQNLLLGGKEKYNKSFYQGGINFGISRILNQKIR